MSESAYPHAAEEHGWWDAESGLTKRELFAAMAMQGLLADASLKPEREALNLFQARVATCAIGYADALIAELSKPAETTNSQAQEAHNG